MTATTTPHTHGATDQPFWLDRNTQILAALVALAFLLVLADTLRRRRKARKAAQPGQDVPTATKKPCNCPEPAGGAEAQ